MFYLFALVVAVFISNAQAKLKVESIIGGIESEPHEFPYMVSLQKNGKHECGGVIIGKWFVLTAAHCIINAKNKFVDAKYTVVAGISSLTDNATTRVEIIVDKAFVPSLYDGRSSTSIDDIAILKLKKKFDLGPNSGLAKLPLPRNTKQGLNANNSFATKEAVVSGFGWDKIETKIIGERDVGEFKKEIGSTSGKLLMAKARIFANNVCQQYFSYLIQDSQLCADIIEHEKSEVHGFCNGDSGGPLVSDGQLVGIISYNEVGCDDSVIPAIYTRVSAYINLIKNAKRNITTGAMRLKTY